MEQLKGVSSSSEQKRWKSGFMGVFDIIYIITYKRKTNQIETLETCIIMQIMLHIEEKEARKRQQIFVCKKLGFTCETIIRKIVYLP